MKNKVSPRSTLGTVKGEHVYRLFYPQVPVIICAKSGNQVAAMPAVSFISVSDNPPLVALSVQKKSRTCFVIRSSGSFSANWLDNDLTHKEYVLDLAKPSKSSNKLDERAIHYTLRSKTPVLAEAEAFMICRMIRAISCSDHFLFLARVTSARASKDFLLNKYWAFKKYKPMLYIGSYEADPIRTLASV